MSKSGKPQKILIATGIFPPSIGGPATYAKNLFDVWRKEGNEVSVASFEFERKILKGLGHLYFLVRNFFKIARADFILVLDTWSVALPTTVACLILQKKFFVRTGGDFLWEGYVERTKKKVLLRHFYETEKEYFSFKERFVFNTTRWILKRASKIIFSTSWQRDIWQEPYRFDIKKTKIVNNFLGHREQEKKKVDNFVFVSSTRNVVWKNKDILLSAFEKAKKQKSEIELFNDHLLHDQFIEKIKNSYAVILVSLGDISPNTILDSITCSTPFVCTKECGFYEQFKSVGLWIDPLDIDGISRSILYLTDEENYKKECEKIKSFQYEMAWEEVAKEILA